MPHYLRMSASVLSRLSCSTERHVPVVMWAQISSSPLKMLISPGVRKITGQESNFVGETTPTGGAIGSDQVAVDIPAPR